MRPRAEPPVLAADEAFIRTLPGGGAPLAPGTCERYSARFGHDFSDVRVHAAEAAGASARRLEAAAYTVGSDIVFAPGRYRTDTAEGSRLLAHELAHVAQQAAGAVAPGSIQCQDFGPEASGAPPDWDAKVKAAATSADKAALLQQAVGLTVVDKTADGSADKSPDPAHLVAYSTAAPQVNFDAGLERKESPLDGRKLNVNAAYTRNVGSTPYVVLGEKALKASDFFWSRSVLSHEFDHVRQQQAGSTLTGDEAELDAWTSTFVRDFHRSYVLRPLPGGRAFVQSTAEWLPLQHYYAKVSDARKDASRAAIGRYYAATIAPHPAHLAVFKFWIHRSIARSGTPDLAQRLNADLSLGVDASASLATTRQFPIGNLQALTYPAGPDVARP